MKSLKNSRRSSRFLSGGARVAAALLMAGASVTVMSDPVHAQEVNASLRGRITVEGGATQVTVIDVNSGITRSSSVGPGGAYNFPSLRPGTYRLEITTPGGVRRTDNFTLSVAQNAVLDFDLTAEPPAEEAAAPEAGDILVVGRRIRSMQGGEVGANISQRQIEQLPQNNRNFLAFADLAPGVAFITEGNDSTRLQGGAQQSRTTNIFIDGVGQKDYVLKNGITGQDSSPGNPFPQSAIGEYRVISSNYKAEFDQVSSVAVTAVTKSGTNEFHGDIFIDFTDERLRARTPVEKDTGNPKTETRDLQFGGSIGGPIVRDLAHFFFTYEGKRIQRPREIFPNVISVAQVPAEYQGIFGSTNAPFDEDLYFAKVDFVPTDRDLIEASIKVRKETGVDINSGANARSTATDIKNDEIRGLLRYERTADTWVNDLKITYEDSAWQPTPTLLENSHEFQNEGRQFLFRVGGGSNFQDKGQKGWGVQNDFTYTGFSNHTIKAGVKMKWVTLNSIQQNNFNPLFRYNAEFGGGFNDDIPFQVVFGAPTGVADHKIRSKNFQLGLYIQDDWDVSDRLTLYYGLRWDYERTPSYLNFVHPNLDCDAVNADCATTDNISYPNLDNANYDINDFTSTGNNRKAFWKAFQPRVGFDWELDDEGRTRVFGGFGRSYDRNSFDFLQQEISIISFANRTINFDTGDPTRPCSGPTCVPWDPKYFDREELLALVSLFPGGGRELRFIDNKLKVPYADHFSLGVRHRITPLLEGEVGYTHVASRDGFAFLLGNRRPDGSFFATGEIWGAPFGFPPPGFGSIIIGTNGIKSDSDAVYFKLNKRYTSSSPWNLDAVYTYTQAEESRRFNEVFSLDYPSLDDYPVLRSAGVSKHRFVAAGAIDLPFGFTLSSKVTLASPPYIYGIRGNTNAERRPVVIEAKNKHKFLLPIDIWAHRQVDFALTKYIPVGLINDQSALRLRVDVINAFNHKNFVNYNGNANVPEFGEVSNLAIGGNRPRLFKLTAGYSF